MKSFKIFVFMLFGLLFFNSNELLAQCCKCFNSPATCSTECTHASGREWCGCEVGCKCGPICGTDTDPGEAKYIDSIDSLDKLFESELKTSASLIVRIMDSVIESHFNYGYTFGSLNTNTLINDDYGLYHLGSGHYLVFRKEDENSFFVKGCDEVQLFKVTAML